jgi:hypothetical protein
MAPHALTKEDYGLMDTEGNSKKAGEAIGPTHESRLSSLKGRSIPSGNNGVLAWFLYTFGYSSLISGNKESSLLALKILQNLDNTLADLLEHRISQPMAQRQEKNGATSASGPIDRLILIEPPEAML